MPVRSLICLLVLFAPISFAQTQSPPAEPCRQDDSFDDFDFWLGEWKVYSNDVKRQFFGDNSITKHHGGCLLKENWRGASGSSGFSINYYNAVTDTWRQVWVANGYSIDYTGGLNDAGAMVLVGSIYDYTKDESSGFRGTWTPLDDGNVIQLFEVFDDDTKSWSVWFEGLYERQQIED